MHGADGLWYLFHSGCHVGSHIQQPEVLVRRICQLKKEWPYFAVAFVIPVLGMLWWWGAFATATIEETTRGPYRFACLDAKGSYTKLAGKQQEVRFQLQRKNIVPGKQATLLMSDPRSTPRDQLSAKTGYLIDADASLPEPLEVGSLPARPVVVARVKAHPLFAYGKAYGALLAYAKKHGTLLSMPTFESYDDSVLSVEMPILRQPQQP
jgi:hypothetical protein